MEKCILDAEHARDACRAAVEDSTVASDHLHLHETSEVLEKAEQKVERLYARWAELEAKHLAYSQS